MYNYVVAYIIRREMKRDNQTQRNKKVSGPILNYECWTKRVKLPYQSILVVSGFIISIFYSPVTILVQLTTILSPHFLLAPQNSLLPLDTSVHEPQIRHFADTLCIYKFHIITHFSKIPTANIVAWLEIPQSVTNCGRYL